MRTFLTILLTALLALIGGGVALQEGVIPGYGPTNTTQFVKTYNGTGTVLDINGESCTTPRGTSVDHGKAVLSFESESASLEEGCESRTSICNNGNYLNEREPFQYESCEIIPPENCEVNGFIVAHNKSKTFYKEGESVDGEIVCDSQTRICNDGEITGDEEFIYLSCFTSNQLIVEEPGGSTQEGDELVEQGTVADSTSNENNISTTDSSTQIDTNTTTSSEINYDPNREPNCPNPFGGSPWAPDQTGTAYPSATVSHEETCVERPIVCAYGSIRFGTEENPGEIAPNTLSRNCEVLPPAPCSSACGTVQHEETVTTYKEGLIPFGSGRVCGEEKIVSTCNNGTLIPAGGNSCSCQIAEPSPCVAPNGETVPHEGSLTLYEYPTIQALPGDGADTCVRQWRQCINGEFYTREGEQSPFTFKYESCEIIEPQANDGGPGGDGVPSEEESQENGSETNTGSTDT